jgi:hypothetical protein
MGRGQAGCECCNVATAQVAAVYLAGLSLIRTLAGPPAVLDKRDCAAMIADLLPLLIDKVPSLAPQGPAKKDRFVNSAYSKHAPMKDAALLTLPSCKQRELQRPAHAPLGP